MNKKKLYFTNYYSKKSYYPKIPTIPCMGHLWHKWQSISVNQLEAKGPSPTGKTLIQLTGKGPSPT